MATFSNIGLEEPSTITNRAATVDINRGGTVEQQEILVIGDPESSLGVAGVLDTTPASTQHGLVVREAEPTTSVRVHQSSAGDLNVTVAGYVAPTTGPLQISSVGGLVKLPSTQQIETNQSTTVNVSSLAGAVVTRSSAANSLHTVYQSSAADLNVTVAGYVAPSTDVAISSGVVQAQQITSSGADMTDSSQASLRVTVVEQPAGGSTQVAISSGVVQVQHITSSGAQMTTNTNPASTSYGLIARDPGNVSRVDANNETTSTLAGDGVFTGTATDVEGYSNISVSLFADQGSASSGMTFQFGPDGTNWDDIYRFTLSGPSGEARRFQFPVTAQFFRVVYTNGSTAQNAFRVQTILHRNSILYSIHRGGDDVSNDRSAQFVKAGIVAQKAGSTTVFTPVEATAGGNLKVSVEETAQSTTVNVSSLAGAVITRSSAANSLHTVYQSSAADLNVTVAGYSTTVNVSSLGGLVKLPSTQKIELPSTQLVNVQTFASSLTSTGDGLLGNRSLRTIQVQPFISSFASAYLPSSAESTIVAAPGASSRIHVFAIALSMPMPTSQTVRFLGASTNELWRSYFNSSVVSAGLTMSVNPPNYLFRCDTNESLAITSSGGTSTGVTYSIGYFTQSIP